MTERSLVVWCPDWPVRAAAGEAGLDPDSPIALIEHGLVHACSSAARAAGVQRGLKLREAQSRCAAVVVLLLHPVVDARRFEPVLTALEAGIPTVQVVRPGLVAIRAAGTDCFYGGERQAAEQAIALVAGAGVPDVRVGVADGPVTAEQAARSTGRAEPVRIVPPGAAAGFLAPLPVALLGLPELGAVLAKLGVRTLGAFAALDEASVRGRFGPEGEAAHRVAAGLDPRRVVARVVPADRDRRIRFEPPLERVDQIAFALKRTAEDFVAALAADLAVCTALAVELSDDRGGTHRRTWLHPRSFTPLDVVDRVRWQLTGAGLTGAVTEVLLHPEAGDAAADHEQGLWGGGPDERIHHALSRVQSMLGHEAVLTAAIGGGRLLSDRRVLAPWGEAHAPARAADRPWPGRLPGFVPAAVLDDRPTVHVLDPAGRPVDVDERGALSAPPAALTDPAGRTGRVDGWAGPWPIDERWWDDAGVRLHRLQATTEDGAAWLLAHDGRDWWAEAQY
ncbi:DNA polymerase Y family protein [Amnibacterium endophyticum]|uniref:DNA polymerase Y family protein n=1 Tax=Amnibacterium endophyticum TaxID=2109337 RepID=A0ABW4LCI7_9MICO